MSASGPLPLKTPLPEGRGLGRRSAVADLSHTLDRPVHDGAAKLLVLRLLDDVKRRLYTVVSAENRPFGNR